jgi:hypothetical protein
MVDDFQRVLISRKSAAIGKSETYVYCGDLHILGKIFAIDQGIGYLDFAVY